jgi:thiol:disulfide interchange protein
MKPLLFLGLVLIVAVAVFEVYNASKDGSENPAGATAFQKLTYEKAVAKAKQENKVVVLDFYATWCGPCRQLDQETFSAKAVQTFLKHRTVALKIDVDDPAELALKYQVTAIPCVVFLDGDGKEIGRLVGFQPADKFLEEGGKIVARGRHNEGPMPP